MDLFCTSSSSSSQDSHSEAANAIEVSCYSSVSEITWKIQKYLKPSKSITCHFTCSAWQINCMTGWWDYCSPSTSHITKPQLGCRVQVAHQEIQRTDRERESFQQRPRTIQSPQSIKFKHLQLLLSCQKVNSNELHLISGNPLLENGLLPI